MAKFEKGVWSPQAVMQELQRLRNKNAELETELATKGSALTYKRYVAIISQSGTNAPVATVLINELSGPIVWSRLAVGNFAGDLTGAFTLNKTATIVSSRQTTASGNLNLTFVNTNADRVTLVQEQDGVGTVDGLSVVVSIEVFE